MIQAHTFDAWASPTVRRSRFYWNSGILAGFAAPLFLWLAGLSLVMAAERSRAREGRWAVGARACRRGLEVFVLAFLFRLQAFVVSPGGHPITLFRVDILNVMGPSMAAAGLVWMLVEDTALQVTVYSVLAAAVALSAPLVRTAGFVNALPLWVSWYIRPHADYTTFTLFPWAGFLLSGAACGRLLAANSDAGHERRLQWGIAVAGLALAWLGWYTSFRPSIYAQSSFWTSSPTWFAIRLGLMMAALAALYALAQVLEPKGWTLEPLARFGRSSLFVYWIHTELVYGYASWAWHRRLPVWGVVPAYAAFAALMYGAVVLKDRVVSSAFWHLPQQRKSGQMAAMANEN